MTSIVIQTAITAFILVDFHFRTLLQTLRKACSIQPGVVAHTSKTSFQIL